MSEKRLRIGFAGVGLRSVELVAALRRHQRANLVAVYDPAEAAREAFARQHEIETECSTFDELLDCVDAVILTSPVHYHAPQACSALARGVHVLSEVPAAVSYEQAKDLVAAARASEAIYAMAENYLYFLPNLVVRELVRAGGLGEPYFGSSDLFADAKSELRRPDGSRTWKYHWWAGRDGHTYPTHSLGPLLQWFDDRVAAVSCIGAGRQTAPEHELQDLTVLLARTVHGKLLRLQFSWLANRPPRTHSYSVQGTEGAYEQGDRSHGSWPAVHLHGRTPDHLFGGEEVAAWEPLAPLIDRYLPDRYLLPDDPIAGSDPGQPAAWLQQDVRMLHDFLDSTLDGREIDVDIYAALDMTLPGLAAETSIAQSGAWIQVPNPRFFTPGIGA